MTNFPFRDAVHDDDGVVSALRHDGAPSLRPGVTIAIPTFNRPLLIRDTLRSALSQATGWPLEIIVVDNASEPANVEALLAHIRTLGDAPVRYFVNDANIGMFGNWNRCMLLARAPWITVLSDDDLLLPGHIERVMTQAVKGDGRTSYTCGFTYLDQRTARGRSAVVTGAILKLKKLLRFAGRRSIDITPRQLFWSNIAGSGLGAVFPVAMGLEVGGFYPEDFPSADYFFHVRMAIRGRVRQIADELAHMRLQANETLKPSTLIGFIAANHRLRQSLTAAGAVPRRWARASPMLIGYERRAAVRFMGTALTKADVERATGERERYLPSALVWMWKGLHGGL